MVITISEGTVVEVTFRNWVSSELCVGEEYNTIQYKHEYYYSGINPVEEKEKKEEEMEEEEGEDEEENEEKEEKQTRTRK